MAQLIQNKSRFVNLGYTDVTRMIFTEEQEGKHFVSDLVMQQLKNHEAGLEAKMGRTERKGGGGNQTALELKKQVCNQIPRR